MKLAETTRKKSKIEIVNKQSSIQTSTKTKNRTFKLSKKRKNNSPNPSSSSSETKKKSQIQSEAATTAAVFMIFQIPNELESLRCLDASCERVYTTPRPDSD